MYKCLLWKKFLHRKHLDNDRFSLSFCWFLFLFLLFSQMCSHPHLNVKMWRILGYAEPEVCVCVSVGSTWFFLSDMPAKWAEERSWCSNIHKINFSCGWEVNFWRTIWNGSPVICVTDLAHPYNLDDPEKILSHTHTCTLARFSYGTILPTHPLFP